MNFTALHNASSTGLHNSLVDSTELEDVFISTPSQNLFCPICQTLFENAMITRECGHSFCESCIFRIDNSLCPLCRRKISLNDVHQNFVLNQLVKELMLYCKYKRFGCSSQVQYMNKKEHEAQCAYKPVECPHASRGCGFKGIKKDLDLHLNTVRASPELFPCIFESLKDYIKQTNEIISQLKLKVENQSNEINELKRKYHDISSQGIPLHLPEQMSNGNVINEGHQVSSVEGNVGMTISSNSTNRRNPSPKERWGINSIKSAATFSGHQRGVTALAFSPKKGCLFSGSHDTKIFIWDVADIVAGNPVSSYEQKPLGILEGHSYTVWALVLSEENDRLYSGSSDGTIICWDISASEPSVKVVGKLIQVMKGHTGKIYTLDIKGELLFSAGADRNLRVWDLTKLQPVHTVALHNDCIWSLVVFDSKLYSGSDDMTIKITNLSTMEITKIITQENKVLSVAVNKQWLVCGCDNSKIKIWDNSSYQHLKTLTEHSWEVWQLQIVDTLLFSGSFDRICVFYLIFDLSTFTCIRTLLGHKGYIHSLLVKEPLPILFSGSGDKTIKVWRTTNSIPNMPLSLSEQTSAFIY